MKAIVNIARRIGLYYTPGALDTPRVLVYGPGGALYATSLLTTSPDSSNLHWSADPITFSAVGTYRLQFQHLVVAVYTTIATDTMVVGVDHISDFDLSTTAGPTFRLPYEAIGDITSSVTAKVIDLSGTSQGPTLAGYAAHIGGEEIGTIVVVDGDEIVLKIDALANKTATFLSESATSTGAAGTFASADEDTTADISVNGGAAQAIDLDGVVDGIANYITSLSAQVTGIIFADSGGQLSLTTIREGSSAKFEITNIGSTFAAITGLSASLVVANTVNNNVADGSAVTRAEIAAVIEAGVKTSYPGDILGVTFDEDYKLVLSARAGSPGTTSIIDLVSGTADLLTSLGLDDLGSLSGTSVVIGTLANRFRAVYVADTNDYSFVALPILVAGPYLVLWYDDAVLTTVTQYFASVPRGYEIITVAVATTVGTASSFGHSAPHALADVLISTTAGSPISQAITDLSGNATLTAPPGTYVLTVRKDGSVFSRNNVPIQVIDSETETGSNAFDLETGYFIPTFGAAPQGPQVCTLFGTLHDFTGTPLSSSEVLVSLVSGPAVLAAGGTFGTAFTAKTDKWGRVEFDVVRGMSIQVALMASSLRRTIVVPSGLLTISTSSAADPTTITTTTAHGLISGESVEILAHPKDQVNGTHVVTVTSTTQFTVPVALTVGGTGGTVAITRANFIARMSLASDPFDVVMISVPAVPRRSL